MPTPPLTISAPELGFVDADELLINTLAKFDKPPTFKLPPIPTPPPTITAPEVLSTDGFVSVDKFNWSVLDNKFPDVRVICFTEISPDKIKSEDNPREPPIFKLPPIPTPPLTISAPDCLLFDTVDLLINTFSKFDVPPTFKLPPMPTPPPTITAPVFLFTDGFVRVDKFNCPVFDNKFPFLSVI